MLLLGKCVKGGERLGGREGEREDMEVCVVWAGGGGHDRDRGGHWGVYTESNGRGVEGAVGRGEERGWRGNGGGDGDGGCVRGGEEELGEEEQEEVLMVGIGKGGGGGGREGGGGGGGGERDEVKGMEEEGREEKEEEASPTPSAELQRRQAAVV